MTPRARQILETRKRRREQASEQWWQEVQHKDRESRRAAAQEPRPEPDYEERARRATRKTP